MFARLWALKTALQHTGWLQYAPNAVLALVFAGLSVLGTLTPWSLAALLPGLLAALLTVNLVFDLVTLKLGVQPKAGPRPAPADPFDRMRARISCRSFAPNPLSAAHKTALLERAAAVTQADFTLGQAPIRLVYLQAPLEVWPVVNAREFLVALAPAAYDRGAVIDVGRSLQHVVDHATGLGIATCWIGPGAKHESVIAHLGEQFDPEQDHIICVCALGYASSFKPLTLRISQRILRRRLPLTELFSGAPLDVPPASAFGRTFEVCQWAPSSFNGQTTRAHLALEDEAVARVDFFPTTASRFYAPVALGIWLANWEIGCQALGIDGRFAPPPEDAHARTDVSWLAAG